VNKNKYRAFILGKMYEVRGLDFNEYGVTVITDGGFYTISNGVQDEHGHLMQSMGLFDKNGVEIFEGDIVESYDNLNREKMDECFINFKNGSFVLVEKELDFISHYRLVDYEIEVVGNIHDKPKMVDND
jgi:uncharacterized phage protein (TIGR01671 family)